MAQIPGTDFTIELASGEQILTTSRPRGLNAGSRIGGVSNPLVVLTSHRYVVFRIKGTFTTKAEQVASFTWTAMTSRLNRSEGTALGPFLYCFAVFPTADEFLIAGFPSEREREAFAEAVEQGFEAALSE